MAEPRETDPEARDRAADRDPGASPSPSGSAGPAVDDHEYKWTTYGVIAIAGLVGAFIVAVTFLAVDLLSGRPALWTPAVLGAALFLGEAVGSSPDFDPTRMMPVVVGYTMVHGVVFIGFASAFSAGRISTLRSQPMTLASGLGTALLMFLGLEIAFLGIGFAVGSELALVERLGSVWVALANALAATGMTLTLGLSSRALHPGESTAPRDARAEHA